MNMSLHRLGPKFMKTLEAKRNESRRLISHFTGLAEVAFFLEEVYRLSGQGTVPVGLSLGSLT